MSKPWRFDVDTNEIPKMDELNWDVSRNTSAAFKLLAATSCRILAGCKRRSIRARTSGYKKATQDTRCWISQTFEGRQVPCVKLTEMCHQMLRLQEKPTQRPFNQNQQASSSGNSTPNHSNSNDSSNLNTYSNGGSSNSLDLQIPVLHARERDDDEEEGPWDAADSMFGDDLFKSGCVLFTQFYKERTKEIRLAYVCGYRDALDDIMKWASLNRTPGQNSVSAGTLAGICTSISTLRRSRSNMSRDSSGNLQRATPSSSSMRFPSPLMNSSLHDFDSQSSSSRNINLRQTPSSSPSRSLNRTPLTRSPSNNSDQVLVDPMAMWLGGNSNKRELEMDTDDDDEPMMVETPKRARFGL